VGGSNKSIGGAGTTSGAGTSVDGDNASQVNLLHTFNCFIHHLYLIRLGGAALKVTNTGAAHLLHDFENTARGNTVSSVPESTGGAVTTSGGTEDEEVKVSNASQVNLLQTFDCFIHR
jgi:hypothetical protein